MSPYDVSVSDPETGGWTRIGTIEWDGERLEVRTDDKAVARIIERVNATDTWDTAEPPEYQNAPVAETPTPLGEDRSLSLARTYLLEHGYGVSESDSSKAKSEIANALVHKVRRYIDNPSEAPDDVDVQEGPQGGYYYETQGVTDEGMREAIEGVGGDQGSSDDAVSEAISSLDEASDEEVERAVEALGEATDADVRNAVEAVGSSDRDVREAIEALETEEPGITDRIIDYINGVLRRMTKERRYVDDPSDAPDGAEVQEGPKGGLYYETEDSHPSEDGGTEVDYGAIEDPEAWLEETYPGVDITLNEREPMVGDTDELKLYLVEIPEDQRGQGIGTAVMEDLTAYADAVGQRIVLNPNDELGEASRGELVEFYERFGFVENEGENEERFIDEDMYRLPDSDSEGQTETADFGDVDFSRENEYGVLHEEEQQRLRDHLAEEHGEEVVEDVYSEYGWMYEWKAHRESEEGVKLGVAYARALGMDEEDVKSYEKIDPDEVTEEHVALAKDLHEAGKTWFRETFGEAAQMNRGFKDGGARMLDSLFTDDEGTVELNGNEMDNWAWDMQSPKEWGRRRSDGFGAIVRADRDIDEFVFTIDGIAGDYTRYNDNAATFDGTAEVLKEDVSIEGKGMFRAPDDHPEATDRGWAKFEGSFFPHRPLGEQDLEAVKMFAVELEDQAGFMGHFLSDESKTRMKELMAEIESHLESTLDADDPVDAQVLEHIRDARDDAERRW